jgi:hypothetical protein
MSSSVVPGVYRFFFTWFDPVVAFAGAYMDFFAPDTVMNSLIPNYLHDPHHMFVFQQMGGGMLSISFLSAVLLRYSTDLGVWKCLQASVLIVDIATLYSCWDALKGQGRLQLGALRGEDWGTIGLTTFVTVLRVAFLAGFGFKKQQRSGMKSA